MSYGNFTAVLNLNIKNLINFTPKITKENHSKINEQNECIHFTTMKKQHEKRENYWIFPKINHFFIFIFPFSQFPYNSHNSKMELISSALTILRINDKKMKMNAVLLLQIKERLVHEFILFFDDAVPETE